MGKRLENKIAVNYPLHWPIGWPRSKVYPLRSPFNRGRTLAAARDFALNELRLLRATNIEISTNIQLRGDGLPYSGQAQPQDRGVAVYFKLGGREHVLAVDKWDRVECNLYAVGKHVEALRAQERYGVGSLEQAFRGYQKALPPASAPSTPTVRPWWEVLGLKPDTTVAEIKAAFQRLALQRHPDYGGSEEQLAELKAARDAAIKGKG